jgi:hypothetical protein
MSMDKLARAFQILQGMEKEGVDILGGLSEAAKSVDAAGKGMSQALLARGHGRAAFATRYLPHLAVAYGAKKMYDKASQTRAMQHLKAWNQERQYAKAMRQAQGGY